MEEGGGGARAAWLCRRNSVQFALNFDFFINLLDTCSVVGSFRLGSALYYHFIFASFLHLFFARCSHIAAQFACLFGPCCIVVGSMAFTLSLLKHTSARSQRVNSKTIVESHQISRFMFATISVTEFTHCNGHERLNGDKATIVRRIHKQRSNIKTVNRNCLQCCIHFIVLFYSSVDFLLLHRLDS